MLSAFVFDRLFFSTVTFAIGLGMIWCCLCFSKLQQEKLEVLAIMPCTLFIFIYESLVGLLIWSPLVGLLVIIIIEFQGQYASVCRDVGYF